VKSGLASFVVAILASACLTIPATPTLPSAGFALPSHVRVQFVEQGRVTVRNVPLEEYVQAAALSEFAPPSGEVALIEQMLEVQAIIGRTYAVSHLRRHAAEGFDLCSSTHCQLYEPGRLTTSRWAPAAAEAVDRTAGVVLSFGGRAADALFHADCGGHTTDPTSVWGGESRPYLLSHADAGGGLDADTHAKWEYTTTFDAVRRALDGDARTRLDGQLTAIDVTQRDSSGRAERVAIRGRLAGARPGVARLLATVVRGEDLRQALTRAFGARSIRSTWFDVRQDRDAMTFAGRGFGHGVGLCQAGALARLKAGATPAEVFRSYYPKTILARAR